MVSISANAIPRKSAADGDAKAGEFPSFFKLSRAARQIFEATAY